MTPTNLRLIQPDPQQHLRPIGQLAADVFSDGNYVDQFCENYIGNSHYDWQTSRLVLDGDQLIHHWGVWGYNMRLETIQLKVAGIGAVATHPGYRKQGWMHQAAQASFDQMRQDGYDLSILRGRHYVKMGYARAWNYVTYRLKLEELPGQGLLKPYQPLAVDQIGAMDALYNQSHAGFSGSAIRPTYRQRHPDDIGVYAWFSQAGELEGYIRALPAEDNPKILTCLEAAGDPLQGLAVLGDLFRHGEYDSLACFTLPYRHPLLQALRNKACIVEDRYFEVSGWRVRLINLYSTLTKLAPLFEKRLAQSQFAGWGGSLALDAGEQRATLHFRPGKVKVSDGGDAENSILGGSGIGRLLIGSDEADELIRQEGLECRGSALALARVLFPNLHPMLSHWDEF
jgi:hypothetical protein